MSVVPSIENENIGSGQNAPVTETQAVNNLRDKFGCVVLKKSPGT